MVEINSLFNKFNSTMIGLSASSVTVSLLKLWLRDIFPLVSRNSKHNK
jgi:hypothetical protein